MAMADECTLMHQWYVHLYCGCIYRLCKWGRGLLCFWWFLCGHWEWRVHGRAIWHHMARTSSRSSMRWPQPSRLLWYTSILTLFKTFSVLVYSFPFLSDLWVIWYGQLCSMWPYCGPLQLHWTFWQLDWIRNRLIYRRLRPRQSFRSPRQSFYFSEKTMQFYHQG